MARTIERDRRLDILVRTGRHQGIVALYDPRTVFRTVHSCTFLEHDGSGNFFFMHRSFMEYFAARHLAGRIGCKDMDGLSRLFISPDTARFIVEILGSGNDPAAWCHGLVTNTEVNDPNILRTALMVRDGLMGEHATLRDHITAIMSKDAERIASDRDGQLAAFFDAGGKVPVGLTFIPSGRFLMGGYESGQEQPLHRVEIARPFLMLSTPVTQKLWKQFFRKNPSAFKGDNRPVEQVTWYDCLVFCNKLSEREGLKPWYYSDSECKNAFSGELPIREDQPVYLAKDADGYRMPTEAEWEYACRAGATTRFWFGNDEGELKNHAWFKGNSGHGTHPVDKMNKPNPWGPHDMHGNVWEWCGDWFGSYRQTGVADPQGVEVSEALNIVNVPDRVMRGGSWSDSAVDCRSACRNGCWPRVRGGVLGFRVVRPAAG